MRYKVRPNINLIDPLSVATVQVLLVPGEKQEGVKEREREKERKRKSTINGLAFSTSLRWTQEERV